ncbi:inner membrane protein [Brachyspira intermedia PWS/A]|uniref:Inner membrane protein n=1 Tax=Brachyspira intermedia (strain ATCC 51140 / PWS/A) TaxID=1045858 RepID=G0EQJ4_BRAIP|nr:YidC/Oxa1 family membrane protein insertase [Brachyspira intermedia]AEM22095.1 inner membrane protein [Brachyspira intermedia PWS/A]
MFFDILYNIFIYPIEFIIEILFYLFNTVFQSGYGVSLFFLSLCINFLSLPLYNIAESWQAKERAIQDKMKPMIDNIKSVYKGDQRYLLIRACQRINGYKTIYAFRGTLGLLIQIPFFMAAYNFVHSISVLNGQSFLFIKDLSKPDSLIHIGSISINLLPFIMTLFSLLAGFIYAKKLKFKESLPLYIVSLIFLVLLYTSPSGLLFYWTINCLFSLIKNIVIEFKLYEIFLKNKYKLLKVYNIFFIIITAVFILLISLASIERKAYLSDFVYSFKDGNIYGYEATIKYNSKIFKSSDLFDININTDVFLSDNIEDVLLIDNTINTKYVSISLNKKIEDIDDAINIYYKVYLKNYTINIFIIITILFIVFNMNKIFSYIFNNSIIFDIYLKNRYKLILTNCLVITILSGIFIPSSLIGASPQEFTNPFYLVINNFTISTGLFLFYPIFIYFLFSEKIKNYITLLSIFIVSILLIDTFIMKGNYININSDFIFDNSNFLKASFKEIYISVILFIFSVLILILFIKKNINILINIYFIIIITLFGISTLNIITIFKEHSKLISISNNKNDIKIFNLSKTGENIFVFILDRAINSYWIDALDRFPEYKEKLDGFIIYPNTVSFSDFTTSISSLYGGYDYLPYELSTNLSCNIKNKHNESLLTIPLSLEKYGYHSILLEPVYANLKLIPDLSIFKDYTNIKAYNNNIVDSYSLAQHFNIRDFNVNEHNKIKQKNRIFKFSIFKMIPINLRYDFYSNGDWFNYNDFNVNPSIYSYAILSNIRKFININNEGNYYNILHNMITHDPQFFSSDYLPHTIIKPVKAEDMVIYKDENSTRHFYANIASINILTNFIDFLKENDVYDNTKIIVVSDHGRDVNTTVFENKLKFVSWYNALLMYKDFNSHGNIKIENNFMTIADVPYLATKHIQGITNPFNNKIITNDYKTNGANIILLKTWDISKQFYNRYNFDIFYTVKDNIFNLHNWKKYTIDWNTKDTNWNPKDSREIELK